MAMRIIGGKAARLELTVPLGIAVRPTTGRAREALFNSLGDFTGAIVYDLCAGSGAMGLEAASRGAAHVVMVEADTTHCRVIENNIAKVRNCGVDSKLEVICADICAARFFRHSDCPNLIFADPPYAESSRIFNILLNTKNFCEWAHQALLVWEIPDIHGVRGEMLHCPYLDTISRTFGATDFLLARFKDNSGKLYGDA